MWLLAQPIKLAKGIKIKLEMFLLKVYCQVLDIWTQHIVLLEKKQTKNAKVGLDLTKKRYKIFTGAIDFVKAYKNVDYVMADINSRLKVFFKNGGSSFFNNISDLTILIIFNNNIIIKL